MSIFRYPDSDCDADSDPDPDPDRDRDCNTGRFPIRDAGLKEAPCSENRVDVDVDVLVDVDGFYKSNSKGGSTLLKMSNSYCLPGRAGGSPKALAWQLPLFP